MRIPRGLAGALAVPALLVASFAAAVPGGAAQPGSDTGGGQRSPRRPADGTGMTPRLYALTSPSVATASDDVQAAAAGLASEGAGSLLRREDGRILVDAVVDDASPGALSELTARGAEVVASSEELAWVTLAVQPASLQALAALPNVNYLTEVLAPMTSSDSREPGDAPDPGPVTSATCPTGILSEGDAQLNADDAKTTHLLSGTGVGIATLSDSYDNLAGAATNVTDAELPGAANPCGNTTPVVVQADFASGGTDEGRAMMQIVHDLAPSAEQTFATAFNGELDFATQVTDLVTAGVDVITDDVTYFGEPMFQDGFVGKAMIDAVAAGIPVFSSAGNSSKDIGGKQVGSYETPAFRPVACPTGIPAYNDFCHDYDPGAGTTAYYSVTIATGGRIRTSLGWNLPMYGVTTDFDMYLLDSTDSIVASSETDNGSSARPFEYIDYTNSTGAPATFRLVIGRYGSSPVLGTPRFKHVFNRTTGLTAVGFDTDSGGDVFGPTIYGHHATDDVFATGATPYSAPGAVEAFSSRGPASICWEPVVGTTPAAAKAGGCESTTVDATATDGTANSFFGSLVSGTYRFYGTSAAAPHAAAVAGLLLEDFPCSTPAEIYTALTNSAVDLGLDVNIQGAGRIDTLAAYDELASCGGRITGSVIEDGSGTPLEGISVRLNDASTNVTVDKVATDANGDYKFSAIPDGSYIIRFVDLDGLHTPEFHSDQATRFTATSIAVTSATDDVIDASLAPDGIGNLRGTITEDGSGDPVAGVSVRLLTTGNVLISSRNSKVDGSYAFDNLAWDDYTMRFIDSGGTYVNEFYEDQPNRFTATVITHAAWFTYANGELALV